MEASIGVAVYPDHGSDPEELLQHADIAMYVAKETHAGFVLFDPTLDRPVPPDQLISWLEQQAARPTPQPHP